MKRSNSYEAAFEAYLQWHRYCYVAVDETRRSMLGEVCIKSLDFIVYGEGGSRLLVDVKGRRYPGGKEGRWRRVWESWSTREDIDGLVRWTELFGPDYQAILEGVTEAGRHLERIKRFDMPGFVPRVDWVREMKRFGILPANHDSGAPVDYYAAERRYWQSLWYEPAPVRTASAKR